VLFSATLLLKKIPAQQKLLIPLIDLILGTSKDNDNAKNIFTEECLNHLMLLCKRAGIENYAACRDLLHFKAAKDCGEDVNELGRKLQELIACTL
jgi:hypothetical protein